MKIHTLKTWPEVFGDLEQGLKTFDVRRNDRNFKVGDTLVLQEFDPSDETYTGEMLSFEITYILQGVFGLPKDLCVMSIRPLNDVNRPDACTCQLEEAYQCCPLFKDGKCVTE